MRKPKLCNKNLLGYTMLLPATLFILMVNLYPLIKGIWMTFMDVTLYNFNQAPVFVGMRNFVELLTEDQAFRDAIFFSAVYTISVVGFSYLIGLGLALLANRPFHGRGLFRAIILIPWVLPTVVAAAGWLWTFSTDGVMNQILQGLGIVHKSVSFFADPFLARCSVIAMGIWKGFPFMALTLLAGLQTVPADVYEAARIDGASSFKILTRVTLPLIKEISLIAIMLRFIWTFNNYEQVFLLTAGGPAKSTMVFSIYSYLTAFSSNRLSYAATISVLMMFLLLAFILVSRLRESRRETM